MGFMSERLRAALRLRGVDRWQLAKATGCSERAVEAWFTGYRNPTCGSLCELCRALDVSADYLLGLKEGME
jgi:transcriptional regulator with XRE-family HTH domain